MDLTNLGKANTDLFGELKKIFKTFLSPRDWLIVLLLDSTVKIVSLKFPLHNKF